MKRIFSVFLTLLLLMGTIKHDVFAVNKNEGIGIVFVVDDSASMKETDPNKLAGEAVRRFVDLLPAEGDKAGIVTYSYDPLEKQDMITISGEEAKQIIKQFSIEKITQEGRNTDTAAGLAAGGALLDADSQSGQKAIILITDGENDLRYDRTPEQSDATLEEFLKKGYRVYTIGVNPTSDTFRQYLSNIAERSGGKVWFPKSSDELNGIIKEVATELGNVSLANSQIVSVDNLDFTDIKQNIPKDVLEANIQIDHEEPISLELVDATGKVVKLDSKKVVVYTEDKYTNIKLLSPQSGDWIIRIKSQTKQIQVKVDWIFNYDVEVVVNVPKEIVAGDKKQATVELRNKGVAFSPEQYQSLTGILTLTDVKSGKSKDYPLTMVDSKLQAEIPFAKATKYSLVAKIKGDNVEKSSKEIVIVPTRFSSEKSEKTGFPLWLLILVGVLGLGSILALVLWFKNRSSATIFQGKLRISYLEDDSLVKEIHVTLPMKSTVTLDKLTANMETPNDFKEKDIILIAQSYGNIQLKTKTKSPIRIMGLINGILDRKSVATLKLEANKQIKLSLV